MACPRRIAFVRYVIRGTGALPRLSQEIDDDEHDSRNGEEQVGGG